MSHWLDDGSVLGLALGGGFLLALCILGWWLLGGRQRATTARAEDAARTERMKQRADESHEGVETRHQGGA